MDQLCDLTKQADRVAGLSGIKRYIIDYGDGQLGIHTLAFLTARGIDPSSALYVSEGTDNA